MEDKRVVVRLTDGTVLPSYTIDTNLYRSSYATLVEGRRGGIELHVHFVGRQETDSFKQVYFFPFTSVRSVLYLGEN